MFFLYFKQTEPLSFEHKNQSLSDSYLRANRHCRSDFVAKSSHLYRILFGEVSASQNTENIIAIVVQNPLFALAAMVGGPIMEEFIFRRALVGIIGKYSNVWVGVVVSAVAFAFAHNDNHL